MAASPIVFKRGKINIINIAAPKIRFFIKHGSTFTSPTSTWSYNGEIQDSIWKFIGSEMHMDVVNALLYQMLQFNKRCGYMQEFGSQFRETDLSHTTNVVYCVRCVDNKRVFM